MKFSKYLSELTGTSTCELMFDDCVSVEDIVKAIIEKYPELQDEALIVFQRDRVLPMKAQICENAELELSTSLVGG